MKRQGSQVTQVTHSAQQHLHHQHSVLEEDHHLQGNEWPAYALFLTLTLLTGPWLILACSIQHRNAHALWDAPDHWSATKQAALFCWVLEVGLLAASIYGIPLALLTSLLPPLLGPFFVRIILWWMMTALLAPTAACLLEAADPRTQSMTRILQPQEVPPPPAPAAPDPPDPSEARIAPTKATKRPKKAASPRAPKATKTSTTSATGQRGRKVPLGTLLLEEQEERERKRTQINFIQPPLLEAAAADQAPGTIIDADPPVKHEEPEPQDPTSSTTSRSEKPPTTQSQGDSQTPRQKQSEEPPARRRPRKHAEPFDGIF